MSSEESNDIPESGAVFTFGKSRFADNIPSHFFVRKDPIINISCGDEHTVVICRNGRAFSFGRNSWGELGLSHRMAVGKPNCIKSLKPRKSVNVACGRAHTLILTDCGQVFSCGNNDDGQLGVQDILCRDAPQEITSVSGIKQVSTGANHSTALNVEGKVYVWGSNKEGQLGLGVDVPFINVPTQLNLECKIVQIACGYYHTLLLSDEGKILAFGEGECGKLGTGDEVRRNEPTLIKSSNIIQFVAAGGNHSAAITSKGKLLLWGSNDRGQLGINIKDYVNQPKLFTALAEDIIIQVSCGENHTAIVTETGTMYTFGDNKHGKLCLDKNDDHVIGQSTYPIKINKFETYQVLKVSCGGCHTMVLAAPRTIGTTSNPFLQNTGRKANMLEGKLSDNNDSESLCSTKSSTKLILPPLQKCNRVQSTIPSPATTPPEPCNLTVDIPTINTVFADNSENNQINSPPKTPDTASQPEEVKAHCEENNMDKKECNTFNDINHTKPIKKSSSFCQPENKENRIEDEVISGKRDDKAVSNESHEINGDFKQDRSCGEKKLLAKYLKIKEKTKAQNAIHYSNKGSLKYSERKSKMCVIL
uniref:X-linked retinitis pigmentosa GTPase regulator n=1 Tax=Rhodnius prolixus TaxID=13249 RepID=T1H8R8_RHOPR